MPAVAAHNLTSKLHRPLLGLIASTTRYSTMSLLDTACLQKNVTQIIYGIACYWIRTTKPCRESFSFWLGLVELSSALITESSVSSHDSSVQLMCSLCRDTGLNLCMYLFGSAFKLQSPDIPHTSPHAFSFLHCRRHKKRKQEEMQFIKGNRRHAGGYSSGGGLTSRAPTIEGRLAHMHMMQVDQLIGCIFATNIPMLTTQATVGRQP